MNNPSEESVSVNNIKENISEESFEQMLINRRSQKYVLRLYVAGNTQKSLRAIDRIKKICEQYLLGAYELEIIDIYKQPEVLEEEELFATPTLVKKLPPPLQKLIGDMTNTEKILVALDI